MKIQQIESDKFICTKPDLTIITFDSIFKSVVFHVLNIIYNIYGNLEVINTFNSDVKRLIINTLLEQIYNRMLKEVGSNNILYINTHFTSEYSEIWEYTDKNKFENIILKMCQTISHCVPIPIYIDHTDVDLLQDSGESKEVITNLICTVTKFRHNKISLSKLKKYSKANGLLHFLDKYHSISDNKNSIFFYKYFKGDL